MQLGRDASHAFQIGLNIVKRAKTQSNNLKPLIRRLSPSIILAGEGGHFSIPPGREHCLTTLAKTPRDPAEVASPRVRDSESRAGCHARPPGGGRRDRSLRRRVRPAGERQRMILSAIPLLRPKGRANLSNHHSELKPGESSV